MSNCYHRDRRTASNNALACTATEALHDANGITEARVEHLAHQCAELLAENAQLRDEIEVLEQHLATLQVTP